jgi:SAM-dependent methyltransferase
MVSTSLPFQPAFRDAHRARAVAQSFGSDAERYDRARPRYPEALVRRVTEASPGPYVLDVGTGTGIAARQFEASGCRVLGVDPDENMARFAREQGTDADVSTFEAWDSVGRTFDTVIAGMAWHWVDPVAGAAKAARLLRPGGLLAPFWYVFEPPEDLRNEIAAVYGRVLPNTPFSRGPLPGLDGYSAFFAKTEEGMGQSDAFDEPERWRFDWEHHYTRDEWLEQVPTYGGHSQFPPGKLDELLDGLGVAVDRAGGSFTMRYIAVVVAAVRRGNA